MLSAIPMQQLSIPSHDPSPPSSPDCDNPDSDRQPSPLSLLTVPEIDRNGRITTSKAQVSSIRIQLTPLTPFAVSRDRNPVSFPLSSKVVFNRSQATVSNYTSTR